MEELELGEVQLEFAELLWKTADGNKRFLF